MRLTEALGVQAGDLVALVGAGGKTAALRRLGAEWASAGRRVILTSSTKIEAQRGDICTREVTSAEDAIAAARAYGGWPTPLLLVREAMPEIARLRGLAPEQIDALSAARVVDLVVAQADGASRRPFKAPSEHEPAVPGAATLVVAMLGADALDAPVDAERCHRPDRVSALGGVALGAALSPEAAARIHAHPDGPFRRTPPGARRAVLINKVEGPGRLAAARAFAVSLRGMLSVPVVLGSVRSDDPVLEVF